MALTKSDIIDRIYTSTELPKNRSSELVDALIEIMKEILERGEDILITGFGKFCVKEKRQRRGRNPRTGRDLVLDARRVVTFRSSAVLRNKLNRR